jgi:hypothetical protein
MKLSSFVAMLRPATYPVKNSGVRCRRRFPPPSVLFKEADQKLLEALK